LFLRIINLFYTGKLDILMIDNYRYK